jgi:HEAT repeat protein
MSVRWKVRLVILLLLILVALSSPLRVKLLGLLRQEPFYGGWPASYWSREVRTYAARAGKPAPPPTELQRFLERLGLYHPTGKPGVLEGGAAAVPVLATLVRDDDVLVRREAVQTLSNNGPATLIVLPVLRDAFDDPDQIVRQGAVRAVCASGVRDGNAEALAVLIAALESQNREVRNESLGVLARYGPAAKPAIPVIIRLLLGPDDYAHYLAVHALGETGPDGAVAIPAIREAMRQEKDAGTLEEAICVLGKMQAEPEAVIPLVAAWFRVREPSPADTMAAGAEAWFQRGHEAALPLLVRALEKGDVQMRVASAKLLGQMGTDARPAVPALIKASKDPAPQVRKQTRAGTEADWLRGGRKK